MTQLYTPYQGENIGLDFSATDPPSELVSSQDVVDRMDLVDTEDEEILASQIKAVRVFLEAFTGMTLCKAKTITAYWRGHAYRLPLPFSPITSVTSVTRIYGETGAETLLTVSTDYWVEGVKEKSVHFNSVQAGYGVKVIYIAGLTDPATIELVRDAILSEVTYWYQNKIDEDDFNYDIGRIAKKKLLHFRQW